MKSFMYHYIRAGSPDLPWFRYLHVENFRKQLDLFQAQYHFPSQDEFLQSLADKKPIENAAILTFDDGLTDHYAAAQELAARGLWGIFYVPTGGYRDRKLLDVHRIHMLIGAFGGARILEALQGILSDEMIEQDCVEKFRAVTYQRQDNDKATELVKQFLNYFVHPAHKQDVLDNLMSQFFPDEEKLCVDYYLTAAQMKDMIRMGMVIGAHSVTHPVFSRLNAAAQSDEITACFNHLEAMAGELPFRTFCYPYGGDHSFNTDTVQILNRENVRFSFSVEQRDINANDLINRIQALPRYDCNQFAHGHASLGPDVYDIPQTKEAHHHGR